MKATVFIGLLACRVLWGSVIPILGSNTPFITYQRGTLHCRKGVLKGSHTIVVNTRIDSATGGFVGLVTLDDNPTQVGAVIVTPIGRAGFVLGKTYRELHPARELP